MGHMENASRTINIEKGGEKRKEKNHQGWIASSNRFHKSSIVVRSFQLIAPSLLDPSRHPFSPPVLCISSLNPLEHSRVYIS